MISVAIDGPAGAGKSTIAKRAASELEFIYVDTGAMYRTIGYYVISKGMNTKSSDDVVGCLSDIQLEIRFIDATQHIFLNGNDVSDKIRTPEVSMAASDVSAVPQVRKFLFDLQRSFAEKYNVIMDGRDIGTVVLPNADVKIFLTATPEARAKRRYDELREKGIDAVYDDVLRDVNERDYNDSHREIAPLKPAFDSILVDTSLLDLQQSINKIISVIRRNISTNE